MERQQSWSVSSQETIAPKMNLLAFLLFMMGALHIYVQVKRQISWVTSEGFNLLRVGFLVVATAGMLEICADFVNL